MMKTRVRTGIFIGLVILAVGALGKVFRGYFIFDASFALLAGVGTWEILHNTGLVKSKFITVASVIFAAYCAIGFGEVTEYTSAFLFREYTSAIFLIVIYCYSMFDRKNSNALEPIIAFGFSLSLGFAFGTLLHLLCQKNESGIFYLLLCFGFSWVSDMGAYFVGSAFGKHKLCPELSPKKTVEGAIGGAVCSLILVTAFCFLFNALSSDFKVNILIIAVITIPMSVISMLGDLMFSYIKRHCGIKDYGKCLPGHGGILDRFDSIIAIAPVLYIAEILLPLIERK